MYERRIHLAPQHPSKGFLSLFHLTCSAEAVLADYANLGTLLTNWCRQQIMPIKFWIQLQFSEANVVTVCRNQACSNKYMEHH